VCGLNPEQQYENSYRASAQDKENGMKTVNEVFTLLQKATEYVLNSDYAVTWEGDDASPLNEYNHYIEAISIPGRTIQTNESVTANSLRAKIGQDISFDDFEITWRLTTDFKVYGIIEKWMSKVKTINSANPAGGGAITSVTTGFYDEYCTRNSCRVGTLVNIAQPPRYICKIQGLYPTTMQSIAFSAEGGEYLKLSTTFSCFSIINLLR